MAKPTLTPEHVAKVRACLALLQEAQGLVNAAAAELCSVPGFATQWRRLSKPYDAIKAAWYDVDRRRIGLQPFESGGT